MQNRLTWGGGGGGYHYNKDSKIGVVCKSIFRKILQTITILQIVHSHCTHKNTKKGEKMKKRKNIIISAITCMVSICLMMFGVYAASTPSVSISGQVSYSARDAKVLVLGKVNGQAGEDQENKIEYPSVADVQNPQENEKVVSATQYMGFTNGTSANDNTDNLAPWTMNSTHSFYEDSTGIRKIAVSFLIRNLSNYAIVATVDFTGVSQTDLAGKNLTRTTTGLTDDNKVYFGKNVVKEISVSYNVANDSLGVTGNNLLDMKITFEKTVFPTPANTKAEHGDTMQSDWEYIFEGDGFAVTRFVGNLPQKDENGKINIIVPSSLVCTDGKSYPVKSLGYPDYAFASLFPEGTELQEVLKSANFFANVDFTEEGDKDENGNVVTENAYTNGSINVTIPEGIKTLNNLVFAGLVLGTVSIPTTLGDCSGTSPFELPFLIGNILEVKFAQGMKRIGSYLFAWSYLGKVTIPASVEEIGSGAFDSTDIEELLIEENSNLKILEVQVKVELCFGFVENIYLLNIPAEFQILVLT